MTDTDVTEDHFVFARVPGQQVIRKKLGDVVTRIQQTTRFGFDANDDFSIVLFIHFVQMPGTPL